ncbi:hypothetical protein C1645_48156 [Glomus cerebriforme]|uniref:Uncharacterized protein n=1 Tax=Glomus cerebriforme TaxID=658196 RepID=A0A397S184_9GLOM|nr:hypothetical protein C1645_48156 [Glomus cerebriforme]
MKRIDGALNDINRCVPTKRKMEDYFSVTPSRYEQDPPRTPPHRIISSGVAPLIQESDKESHIQEFSNSYSEREDVNIDYDLNEDNYLRNVHLSQEDSQDTMEENRIVEKIKRIKYRLFDYRVINLSEQDFSNPVNKLTASDKRMLKEIWNSVLCCLLVSLTLNL